MKVGKLKIFVEFWVYFTEKNNIDVADVYYLSVVFRGISEWHNDFVV